MAEPNTYYSGTKLAEIIRAQGVRQDWLASKSGISQAHLSRIVRGQRLASREVAERIAGVLRVPFFSAFELPNGSELMPNGSEAACA